MTVDSSKLLTTALGITLKDNLLLNDPRPTPGVYSVVCPFRAMVWTPVRRKIWYHSDLITFRPVIELKTSPTLTFLLRFVHQTRFPFLRLYHKSQNKLDLMEP